MINNIELFEQYQKQALDLEASIWISASAGGGKTTLIIKRILKILIFSSIKMFHVEHSQIFAITYTNEAANEIKQRIKNKLLQWKESDGILNQDLDFFEIKNHFNDHEIKQIKTNCRNFFDKQIFHLIKISTFHSFCFDILKQFQNELNINLDKFHLIEEESITILLENEIKQILVDNNIVDHYYEYIVKIALSLIKYQKEITCSMWNDLNLDLKTILSENVPRGTLSYEINKKVKNTSICSTWNIRSKISQFSIEKKLFHVKRLKQYLYKKNNTNHITNTSKKQRMFHVEHSIAKLTKKFKIYGLAPRETFDQNNLNTLWKKNCSTWNNLKRHFDKILFYKKYLYEKFNITNNHYHCDKAENVPRGTFTQNNINLLWRKNCSTWNNLKIDEIKKIDITISEQLNQVYKQLLNHKNIKRIFDEYLEIFLTKNLTPKINLSKKEIFQKEQDVLMFHVEQLSIADNMYNSKLIFNIVKNSFQNIEKYKEQNNFLSFADIINDTLLLLESDKNKDSILYTLNKKIHHLIIDESQDNSQKQWNIVKILFENLFIERHKSIFIVGDVKQSIYKFQGAQPEYFNLMKIFFQNKAQEWQKRFYFIEWNFSFRMPQTISTYVDNFFNSNGFSKYLTSQKNFMLEHISLSSNVPRGTSFYRINKKIKSARICSMWNIRSKISKSFMEKKLFHMEQFKRSLYRKKNISHTNNASKKQKMFHMEHCLIKLIKKLKAQEFVPCGTFVQKFLNPLWGKNCSTWNEPQAVKIETNQTLLNLVMTKNQNHSMMILFRSRNQIMKRLIEELRQKQIPIKYNLYENIIEHNTTKIILLINEILINYREQNNLQIQLLSQLLNNNTQEIQRLLLKIQNTSIKNIYNVTIKIIINCFNNNLDPIIVTKLLEIAEKLKNQNLHSIQSFNHFLYQNKIEVLLRSKDDSKITISTVHGSKGLESDIVIIADDILKQTIHEKFYFNLKKKTFILLKNKNCFYIDFFKNQLYYEEYEENMRLFYVAMTRAKKTLIFLNDAPRRTNSCAIDDF